ncbi:MAG: type II/IV secretion system protein [Patescibacteria group bacterium]|nr:type II/IV secretion system protein [Patescibacteria group bacterium]MDE2019782.1 type II/IV secretion system protein [Patescibacteria group bacterium]
MKFPLPPARIKSLLTAEGLIGAERFDALLAEAERKNQNILDVLISEKVAEPDYLNNLIARTLGVDRIDLGKGTIDKEVLQLLPETIARDREVILFRRETDGTLDVAMVDPSDLETIEFLAHRFKARVKPYLTTSENLRQGYSVYGYEVEQSFKKIIEDNVREAQANPAKDAKEMAAQLPIVGIVDNILSYAIAMRASDIHIEVLEESTFVRYRIDGILYEILEVTKTVHPAIIARIKLLSGLKIDEHFEPQDGRFRHRVGNETVDVRVSVIPTFYGEKVVMRLLEATQKPLSLEEVGLSAEAAQVMTDELKKAYGMVLVCGPTGSGKTTTLYALMNILNRPQVNITTVEDPIEYNMRYVNQTQINPQAGITFASGLRALLRQDPNIIMVGEIRDGETAGIAVEAALTGHLLLSSLHTNDAPTAIPRLFDLGVQAYLVSSVLNVVIAQRLVRKICPSCIYSYDTDESTAITIENQRKVLGIPEGAFSVPKILYRGKGCAACNGVGYVGRFGIFEVLGITDPLRKIIATEPFDDAKFRIEAHRSGMKMMFEDGLEKAELALTTIDEVLRVIRE